MGSSGSHQTFGPDKVELMFGKLEPQNKRLTSSAALTFRARNDGVRPQGHLEKSEDRSQKSGVNGARNAADTESGRSPHYIYGR